MSGRLPPLYALRAFEVAARCDSFTQAAEVLCLTQSAVSRHVKGLEQALGCQLFERRGPKLRLTDAGHQLAQELSRSFRRMEQACSAVRQQGGALRLKAPTTITLRWLLPALEGFHAEHPDQRVQLTSVWMDPDAVDFQSEPFDCAVLLADGRFAEGWGSLKLFDEWLVPVCSPALQASRTWTTEALACAPLLHPSRDGRDWRRWLQRLGLEETVDWRTGTRFDSLELGMSAAAQGHGVSIADLALVHADLQRGALSLPLPTAVRTGDAYYLVWPQQRANHRALEALRAFLAERTPGPTEAHLHFLE